VKRIPLILVVLLFAATFLQCRSLPYYEQAVSGQMAILNKRQPISGLIGDPATPAALREKLLFILAVREFAENKLQLPVRDNYESYVALDRPYVVWNVFAASEFSLTPKTWCFPVVGCVAYRGYFAETEAEHFGDSLVQQGYDVFIGGAIAYSTLGWFDDPVLSTFFSLSKPDIAALIFHELAHGLLYVKDDTAFNESFATAVEQEGLRRWQIAGNDPKSYEKWLYRRRLRSLFTALISDCRAQLEALYKRDLPLSVKRAQKADIFNQMRARFGSLKSDHEGMAAYDAWFNRPINNAQLISVATYHDWVPAFGTILSESGEDLAKFYRKCQQLAKTEPSERLRILEQYARLGRTGHKTDGKQPVER